MTEIVDAATELDGTAPVSEQAVHSLRTSGALHLLRRDDGGRIVGYANLTPPHGAHPAMAEVVVDGASRGRGIGTVLVSSALARGGPGARVWAHGDLEPARAIAARLGLVRARELLQMRRSLAGELPDVVVPEDISLRTYAGPADDAELLRVNEAAFRWHPEQGGWTERDIAVRRDEDWFDPEGLFVAVAGPVLGFHWTKVHTETDPHIGEVYVVAVDPAAQGRGLGRLLTLAGLHYLRERALGAVLLYTEADNTAALHTYDRLGFQQFHSDVAYSTRDSASSDSRSD